jgi:hypothetical protein
MMFAVAALLFNSVTGTEFPYREPTQDMSLGVAEFRCPSPNCSVRAIAVSDNKGGLAILITAEGTLAPPIVDVASARLEKDFGVGRSSLLFLGGPGGRIGDSAVAITDRLYTAARDALRNLAPARVTEAQVLPGTSERVLTGRIRAAYTNIDLGLSRPSYPVQAIRFGRTITILALAGEPQADLPAGVVVLKNANGFAGPVEDSGGRIADAIRNVLARVR